ncbi:MAG: anaerobic ribonucleoside-triphosphate reductase activating protein [Oscillospiraceae bacterium]|nr:anaerobic ribonucleoside-triphosphate reductase activating protein [Oscillospiraceae bacterium]
MNYGEIKNCDISNGPGVRVSLFVSGCTHHCEGCFNPMTWDFEYGEPFDENAEQQLMDMLAPDYINGFSLLGGEPLEHENQKRLLPLLRRVKEVYPNKSIWCYTGYTFETDILGKMFREYEETEELMSYIDILVDGEFILEQKNISLRFRGSENQRIIDVKKSLRNGFTVLWSRLD